MTTLDIKDLQVSVSTEDGPEGDPQGRHAHHQQR